MRELTSEQKKMIENVPESGMGYHIVDVKMKKNYTIQDVIILNSTYFRVDIDIDEIEEIIPKTKM